MSLIIEGGYRRNLDSARPGEKFDYWRDVISDEYVHLDIESPKGYDAMQFDGLLVGGLDLGKIRFSEVLAQPQIAVRSRQQLAQSPEEDFLISFQLEQECVVRQHGREALLTPGSFAMYESTSPYSLSFQSPFHQFVLQMPRELISRYLTEPDKYTAIALDGQSGIAAVMRNFIFSLAHELSNEESGYSEELSGNLMDLIALSFSSSVLHRGAQESQCAQEALRRRIRQFIGNNIADPRLDNARIAASQKISLRYLHKLFEDEPESIHGLLLRKRLAMAHQILSSRKGNSNVENLAFQVGFSSASHFSRVFKRHYGVSPSEVPNHR